MSNRTNWVTITLILIIILAVSAGVYLKQKRDAVAPQIIELAAIDNCDPAVQVCKAANESIELRLHFPKQPVYLAPFPVEVIVVGDGVTAADAVVLDFKMTGMDMGVNKTVLSKSARSGKPEQRLWKGNMTLPVCITGRADWQVLLQVSVGETVYQADFPIKVEKAVVNSN